MKTPDSRDRLRKALQDAGSGWLLELWAKDQEENLDAILAGIEDFQKEYRRRFRDTPDPLARVEENLAKWAAFFQVDTLQLSVEMKIAIWRILLGCEIKRLEVKYKAGQRFSLTIVLKQPYGKEQEEYATHEPQDFRALRHFGTSILNDASLFLNGYYAIQ